MRGSISCGRCCGSPSGYSGSTPDGGHSGAVAVCRQPIECSPTPRIPELAAACGYSMSDGRLTSRSGCAVLLRYRLQAGRRHHDRPRPRSISIFLSIGRPGGMDPSDNAAHICIPLMAATLVDDRDRRTIDRCSTRSSRQIHIIVGDGPVRDRAGNRMVHVASGPLRGGRRRSLRPRETSSWPTGYSRRPRSFMQPLTGLWLILLGGYSPGRDLAGCARTACTCWRVRVGCRSSGCRSGCAISPRCRGARAAQRFRGAITLYAALVSLGWPAFIAVIPSSISWLRNIKSWLFIRRNG